MLSEDALIELVAKKTVEAHERMARNTARALFSGPLPTKEDIRRADEQRRKDRMLHRRALKWLKTMKGRIEDAYLVLIGKLDPHDY